MCLKFPVRRSPVTTRQGTPAAQIRREAVTREFGREMLKEGESPQSPYHLPTVIRMLTEQGLHDTRCDLGMLSCLPCH